MFSSPVQIMKAHVKEFDNNLRTVKNLSSFVYVSVVVLDNLLYPYIHFEIMQFLCHGSYF